MLKGPHRRHFPDDALADDGSKLSWQIDSGVSHPHDHPSLSLIHSQRCLGGSSSINGMVWYHPTQPEIDTLKSLGNKGWDWNSLYPYMKAVENNHLPNNEQARKWGEGMMEYVKQAQLDKIGAWCRHATAMLSHARISSPGDARQGSRNVHRHS